MVLLQGKFSSANQKHYPDQGSDISMEFLPAFLNGETSDGV